MNKRVTKNWGIPLSLWQDITVVIVMVGLTIPFKLHAQKIGKGLSDSTGRQEIFSSKGTLATKYPRVVGYLSFIVPIVTINKNSTTTNFNGTTSIGFPVGVNILYSDRFGFSYEFTPTIRSGNGSSKVSNLLFDPGPMFRFEKGFTIITRLAFETSGRYGFTPVFNKVYLRTKNVSYFAALSTPARFGNIDPPSVGLNVQFGFIFN